mgnify:CR=1 FL=1
MLGKNGITPAQYHAGLAPAIRTKALKEWMCGEKQVMVATNAFGMGIDKPDVRLVVHWHIPLCPEDYFQQAGRAGRDGKPSRAVILYDEKTLGTMRYFSRARIPVNEAVTVYKRLCAHYGLAPGEMPSGTVDFQFDGFCLSQHLAGDAARQGMSYLVRAGAVNFYGTETMQSRAGFMRRAARLRRAIRGRPARKLQRLRQHMKRFTANGGQMKATPPVPWRR